MVMDSIDSSSSPPSQSQYQYQIGHPRHFYLAVDRLQFKMQTLVDLLDLVGRRPCLPIVVCCSTRDDLDSLCSSLSPLPFISSSALYSDLAEDERAFVLDKFSQVVTRWNQVNHTGEGNEDDLRKDDTSHMIIVTDACLPLLTSGESPMNAHLLINYELPAKKETYGRRLAACLTADGIVINMVVGGEVVTLKSIEESTSIVMQEMPMQILDIL
ncbi:putative RNA helicase [Medicago truncatula]|uniref:ATP-dependent RNA helicase eIF4A-like protein, putative n=1 Tax=Medicago truncatula TaxID=3880 RepID=G7K6Q4_MEDTR|nr:ATP-dependent RNA helicase eIF4A isoform X1 [Medicago truncatula]AES94711.1 ATP-dependent RNA helicase eIF4A-like protein, putative [Medicago truncatula]RHN54035.1 putative RNA helicase [Medicago truncatula]